MTSPLEQIKERLEKMKIQSKLHERCHAECATCGYNQALSNTQEILPSIIQEVEEGRDKEFAEILEINRNETLWGDKDSNEVMKESIDNFIIAVKDCLASLKEESK